MELSQDQREILTKLYTWCETNVLSQSNATHITIGGYAGTGKTTLISILRKLLRNKKVRRVGSSSQGIPQNEKQKKLKIAFCSYTGRAVQVLKTKLKENDALFSGDSVSTIHGLIYSPIENENGEIVGWKPKDKLDVHLIIVDEASMIDEQIWVDLTSYNIPVIAVGDHGQLPPINGNFNLMSKPQLMLQKIHRQAVDNPIIHVATHARESGDIPIKTFGKNVVKYSHADMNTQIVTEELLRNYTPDTIVLCGYNSTRNKINQFIRSSLGFMSPQPQQGDRVICLRNNHIKNIYNGMLGTVIGIQQRVVDFLDAEIKMDGVEKPYKGKIYGPQFDALTPINFTEDRKHIGKSDLFDFGYALTVHKAQGGQASRVILFEERFKQMDDQMWKRWLYTGVTRAENELFLIG